MPRRHSLPWKTWICCCIAFLLALRIQVANAAPWAEGKKRLLYIRADFPDYAGEPIGEAEARKVLFDFNKYVLANSNGKFSFEYEVTPVLRLPQTAEWYAGHNWGNSITLAARAEAVKLGIDPEAFQLEIVAVRNPTGSGGVGAIGRKGLMLSNGFGLGITAHELAHNLGMHHASFWVTNDGDSLGDGHREEYGIPFDPSSGGGVDDLEQQLKYQYNSWYKSLIGWLPASEIQNASESGKFSLSPHDVPETPNATAIRAIRVPVARGGNYWLETRRAITERPWMMNSVLIYRTADNVTAQCDLLDMTPESADGAWDAGLLAGRTFSDPVAGIHITALGPASAPKRLRVPASVEFMFADSLPEPMTVVVNRGQFPGNHNPRLSFVTEKLKVAVDTGLEIGVQATDEDGDDMTYSWTFGDGTVAGGRPEVAKTWDHAGEYVVECVASDMKGGIARASAVVTVTSPNLIARWHRISGRVTEAGQPVEGANVQIATVGDVRTDSDGNYTIPSLAPGLYAVSVRKQGYAFAPAGFVNPIRLGPNRTGIDFVASKTAVAKSPPLYVESYAEIADVERPQPVTLVMPAPGEPFMFARGRNAALWYREYREGRWSGWKSLGGTLTSAPAAVSWGRGRVDVFARAGVHAILHKWYQNKAWSQWETMEVDGPEDSALAVTSWSEGRLDLFARGLDNALWHRWFGGGWSGWESLGGELAGAPAAVSWGKDRIDIVAAGSGHTASHKAFDAQGWSDWETENLPEGANAELSISSLKPGRLDVFSWGKGGTVYHQTFEKVWSTWKSVGGQLTGPPTAYSPSPGSLTLIGPVGVAFQQRVLTDTWDEWQEAS